MCSRQENLLRFMTLLEKGLMRRKKVEKKILDENNKENRDIFGRLTVVMCD